MKHTFRWLFGILGLFALLFIASPPSQAVNANYDLDVIFRGHNQSTLYQFSGNQGDADAAPGYYKCTVTAASAPWSGVCYSPTVGSVSTEVWTSFMRMRSSVIFPYIPIGWTYINTTSGGGSGGDSTVSTVLTTVSNSEGEGWPTGAGWGYLQVDAKNATIIRITFGQTYNTFCPQPYPVTQSHSGAAAIELGLRFVWSGNYTLVQPLYLDGGYKVYDVALDFSDSSITATVLAQWAGSPNYPLSSYGQLVPYLPENGTWYWVNGQ